MTAWAFINKLLQSGKGYVQITDLNREYDVTKIGYSNRSRLVFFTVKGSPIGCVTNLLSSRRDLYTVLDVKNDIEAYNKLLNSMVNPIEPTLVDFGDHFVKTSYDLSHLPFIKFFKEDGGSYLTSSIVIACLENICNASVHRVMYIDKDKATMRIAPRQLNYIYAKNVEKGRDTPVAIILDPNPVTTLAASSSPTLGVFEINVATALGSVNSIAKTPVHGLPVPTSATLVLEGLLSKEEYVDEGPFVDILGIPDARRKQPLFKLEAIYINKNVEPLVHVIVPSLWEHIILMGFPREAEIYGSLRKTHPSVKSVRLTNGGCGWFHAVVSIDKIREGDGKLVGLAVVAAHPSVKHVVVVDGDIDVDDPEMVEWAIATRVKASESLLILKDVPGSTMDPRSADGLGDKLIIDATKPLNEPWVKYRRVSEQTT